MKSDRPARVCVPVCAKSFSALEEACVRAAEWSDMVELRLDCLEIEDFEKLAQLLSKLSRPAIVTFRPEEQGGYRRLARAEREAFWKKDFGPGDRALFDIEWDLIDPTSFPLDWSRVIVSHHDFTGVPADLGQIYERLAATPARILKIAVRANDITDCIAVFDLIDRGRHDGREVIAISMGNAGIATRILGPSRGAFLTYGSLEDETATAPGQVNARQLRSLYRIERIDEETMICGLAGLPVMHSVSPHAHNAAFAAEGINGVYLPFEVRDIGTFIRRMAHPLTRELDWNLRGLSVTAPHKSSVMSLLDWIEPDAREIGAVNTIVIEGHELRGYNTDAHGLIAALQGRVESPSGLRVAVIGAGGAARAAVWALKRYGANVTLFARDVNKARSLAEMFETPREPLAGASFAGYDVVINATPLGSGEFLDQTPATADQLSGARLAYDLVYNPIDTRFLRTAHEAGCETLGGLQMLVAQARLQFELWTGKKPSHDLMYDSAAAALGQ